MSGSCKSVEDRFRMKEDNRLVEVVSGYEFLWRFSHPEHKNAIKKDEAWREIGEKLGKSGIQCKSRWRNIRDYYKKFRKEGGKSIKRKRANYLNKLSFLDETLDQQVGASNAQTTEKSAASECAMPSFFFDESDDADYEAPSSTKTISPIATVHKNDLPYKEAPEPTFQSQGEEGEDFMSVETVFQPDFEKEDEIDHFFKAMALTVKRFSPADRAEAKFKVMNIVSSIEMRQFTSKNNEKSSVTSDQ